MLTFTKFASIETQTTMDDKHQLAEIPKVSPINTIGFRENENPGLLKTKVDQKVVERNCKKPPHYIHIQTNKPIGNVKIVELNFSNTSDCKCERNSDRPCAPESDCLNRMLMVECNPQVCSAGENCLNQSFQNRLYPPMMPYETDNKGWGLRTLANIKKGDFIIEYVGEIINKEEYKRRVSHMIKNQDDNFYFLAINKNRILDAKRKGNVSRFMNHSCDPNCEAQKWMVNCDSRVGFFALKDIAANAELTFDYNFAIFGSKMKPCSCGSKICSGFIGKKAIKINESVPTHRSTKIMTYCNVRKGTLSVENAKKNKISQLPKPERLRETSANKENKVDSLQYMNKPKLMENTIKDTNFNARLAQTTDRSFVGHKFCIRIKACCFNDL